MPQNLEPQLTRELNPVDLAIPGDQFLMIGSSRTARERPSYRQPPWTKSNTRAKRTRKDSRKALFGEKDHQRRHEHHRTCNEEDRTKLAPL